MRSRIRDATVGVLLVVWTTATASGQESWEEPPPGLRLFFESSAYVGVRLTGSHPKWGDSSHPIWGKVAWEVGPELRLSHDESWHAGVGLHVNLSRPLSSAERFDTEHFGNVEVEVGIFPRVRYRLENEWFLRFAAGPLVRCFECGGLDEDLALVARIGAEHRRSHIALDLELKSISYQIGEDDRPYGDNVLVSVGVTSRGKPALWVFLAEGVLAAILGLASCAHGCGP